jgi:hypothetical protein
VAAVDVAADCRHRGDARQRVKMARIADIARVQDAVDAFKSLQRLGAEQTMGVGDDADPRLRRWLDVVAWSSSCCSSHAARVSPAM